MSDDLIRRSDAIAEIYKVRTPDVASHHYAELFINAVRRAPSADRPQGEWKSVKASIYPYGYDVECSVCGFRMGSSFGYRYCPNCGSQMKGADDDR